MQHSFGRCQSVHAPGDRVRLGALTTAHDHNEGSLGKSSMCLAHPALNDRAVIVYRSMRMYVHAFLSQVHTEGVHPCSSCLD